MTTCLLAYSTIDKDRVCKGPSLINTTLLCIAHSITRRRFDSTDTNKYRHPPPIRSMPSAGLDEPSRHRSFSIHRRSIGPHHNSPRRSPRTTTDGTTAQDTNASYLFVAGDATSREPTERNSIWLRPGDIMAINRNEGSLLCLHSTADGPSQGSRREFEISHDFQQPVRAVASLIPRRCYSVDAPDTNDQLTIIARQRQLRERTGSHSRPSGAVVIRCLPWGELPDGGPWSHVLGVPGETSIWASEVGGGNDWGLEPVITSRHRFPPENPELEAVGQDA
jgi:hypothetical protein